MATERKFQDKPAQVNIKSILDAQPKVKIVIEKTADETAIDEPYIGVQGYGFKFKRGVAVEVPQAVVNVLNESVKTVYRQQNRVMVAHDVPAYPFRILP